MPSEPPVAIYHLHVKNISRRDGRSAVAAAAYRAGETLPNEAEEKDSAFAGKRDVVFSEIRLPTAAPAWMADRAKLWNAVEAAEKRKDARLAKEIEFSLLRELARSVWIDVAREMADSAPHESRLDWLDVTPSQARADRQRGEDRLDWLTSSSTDRDREAEPERDHER